MKVIWRPPEQNTGTEGPSGTFRDLQTQPDRARIYRQPFPLREAYWISYCDGIERMNKLKVIYITMAALLNSTAPSSAYLADTKRNLHSSPILAQSEFKNQVQYKQLDTCCPRDRDWQHMCCQTWLWHCVTCSVTASLVIKRWWIRWSGFITSPITTQAYLTLSLPN
jgi:hypothetical protein